MVLVLEIRLENEPVFKGDWKRSARKGGPVWLIELIRKQLLNTYIKTSFGLYPKEREQFLVWRAVNAAAFLMHSLPEDCPFLFEMIQAGFAGTQEGKRL